MRPVAFLRQTLSGLLENRSSGGPVDWKPTLSEVSHHVPAQYLERFVTAGFKARHFFPHRIHYLRKNGPDGARLAEGMCNVRGADYLWQAVLFALPPRLNEFPSEVYFDRDVAWHQQHFGLAGQVASMNLAVRRNTVFTMANQSDLVQRISRRRDLKTRIENAFKGWHHLLVHSALGFAAERGLAEVRVPTSQLAMRHTDRTRIVQPELFERVYDDAANTYFVASRRGDWWSIDVARNSAALVPPERRREERSHGKTICICHDIERGYGHREVDAEFSRRADDESPPALARMLELERQSGVRATYNVVGCILTEVRESIEADGHSLAFHSYDHDISRDQLERCREVDYRVKGYRPPRSRMTDDIRDEQLRWHNFEWLASSASSLRVNAPRLKRRLAHVPIHLDDYPLHSGRMSYESWLLLALDMIRKEDFVAISLHDCYASHWLPHYEQFLKELLAMGRLRTMDDVASDLYLASGV